MSVLLLVTGKGAGVWLDKACLQLVFWVLLISIDKLTWVHILFLGSPVCLEFLVYKFYSKEIGGTI